jgi:pimeloyl-ACP methyl ester carboxylesterase
VDTRDMHFALSEFDRFLTAKDPERITARALMGYSMGGFHALHLAATESTNAANLVKFDRFVAIDAPVRLDHAISQLDEHFRAALEWPAEERTGRIEQTILKVAALARNFGALSPDSTIPFSAVESKFLIGLAFRLSLRDIIFLSQSRTNQGILNQPINKWRREPLYDELLQYSFADYLEKFVTPYYLGRGVDLGSKDQLGAAVDLRTHVAGLKANRKVRVIENANDILLGDDSLAWLRETFAPEHLTVFESGGHLGNLRDPAVQRAVLEAIADLKTTEAR